ncbi:ORF_31 [Adoxophyes orana granulovirus]|uniref:ORF_31 n=1 Tax=Adoxophyes orana granulovirus TaxID=170617 RepID=Q7T9Y4_GVAO|nr:ORF_31 [Adoxophyes orana granulovirus]AAP85668.1 ORF_31 [Adoxophyes orana granulovirus]
MRLTHYNRNLCLYRQARVFILIKAIDNESWSLIRRMSVESLFNALLLWSWSSSRSLRQ